MNLGIVSDTLVISLFERLNQEDGFCVQARPTECWNKQTQRVRLSFKNTKSQESSSDECLSSMYEALGSIPTNYKKNQQQNTWQNYHGKLR